MLGKDQWSKANSVPLYTQLFPQYRRKYREISICWYHECIVHLCTLHRHLLGPEDTEPSYSAKGEEGTRHSQDAVGSESTLGSAIYLVKYIGPRIAFKCIKGLEREGIIHSQGDSFSKRGANTVILRHTILMYLHTQLDIPTYLTTVIKKYLFAYCACVCEMSKFIQCNIFSSPETLLL